MTDAGGKVRNGWFVSSDRLDVTGECGRGDLDACPVVCRDDNWRGLPVIHEWEATAGRGSAVYGIKSVYEEDLVQKR